MPRCPVCGENLVEVGYPKDFFQEYRCPNGCSFETPLSWKIKDRFTIVFAIVVLLIIVVFVRIATTLAKVRRG